MSNQAGIIAVTVALALLWVGLAAWLAILAARRLRLAESVLDTARHHAGLLERSPARPVAVGSDGSVSTDPQLLRDLGLKADPRRLSDFAGDGAGLREEDVAALVAELDAARESALPFVAKVQAQGSGRVFEVRGEPSPLSEPSGAMLLWFYDLSAGEEEKDRLSARMRQAETALASLTQLIEAAPFPMWYRGPDLRLGLVNQAFVQAVEGGSSSEVVERQIELIDAPGREGPAELAKTAQQESRVVSRMQAAIIRGERRMLRLVDVPLASGAVAGFAVDVQDLEDARTELSRHIESQRELADRMTAGTAQFDADRTLGFFNRPFAAMSGVEPDWLSERPEFDRVIERMRENQRLPEVRDFPAWREERRGWFTSPEEAIEEEWTLPSGDHIRVVAQPLPDGGLRLFFEDRTEQLRLASARDTLLRVRSATFNNLFEAISVFASDGRLYLWNRRFVEDWGVEEEWLATHPGVDDLVPVFARKLVNPAASAQIREMVRQTMNERESATGRLSMTDGREFQFAAVPLPDGNALLTMLDVTDSSRIEAALRERASALEQADRVKTDFVANMSYELRTPLTSIGGFAELLEGGYAGKLSAKGADYVRAILESVGRLSSLVDNVLDLTTADSTEIVVEKERVDVAGLTRAACDQARERAAEKEQTLEADIAAETGFVFGDARRLRESLEHVLYNAIAYTDRGGEIRLSAGGDEAQVVVQVRDNGRGIAEDELPSVFDRFRRVDQGGFRGEAALGLGLPLTRQFIEAHGGTVELQSKEGAGTTVTLTIPRGER
ncbi:MAG: ATP-binding protein [Sphingomicrobium sp.]